MELLKPITPVAVAHQIHQSDTGLLFQMSGDPSPVTPNASPLTGLGLTSDYEKAQHGFHYPYDTECIVTLCQFLPIQPHSIVQERNRALLADFAMRALLSLPRYRRTITKEEGEMKRLAAFSAILTLASPALALAEEHGGYRGIGTLYFTFMGAILIYGVYDAFGKMAMYVAAPFIVVGLYLMLPAH